MKTPGSDESLRLRDQSKWTVHVILFGGSWGDSPAIHRKSETQKNKSNFFLAKLQKGVVSPNLSE